jgi:hypothetical protein
MLSQLLDQLTSYHHVNIQHVCLSARWSLQHTTDFMFLTILCAFAYYGFFCNSELKQIGLEPFPLFAGVT